MHIYFSCPHMFHAATKQVLSVLIHEMDIAALHATSQKNAVRILHHLRKAVASFEAERLNWLLNRSPNLSHPALCFFEAPHKIAVHGWTKSLGRTARRY